MKSGLESKWGISRFLQARDYRRAATNALRFANAVSDRVQNPGRASAESYFAPGAGTSGASCQFGFGISDPRCLPGSDPAFDRVISVAKPLYRSYLCCNDAFPTPSKKDEWAAIVWCEASVRTGKYPGPLFRAEWFTVNSMSLLSEMKTKLRHAVETLYEFNPNQTPGSISYNIAHANELLTKMAFIYREHNSSRNPLHKYQHPIIQKAINIMWFKHKNDDGMTSQEHFSPIPIPALALVLTVTQCCIDEWTDGTRKGSSWDEERFKAVYRSHLEPLSQIHEGGDPLEEIRRDLLRNAR
ncbi:hypothetical protein DFH94DRAFT_713756 [Russula ochroleuca]|uniref:DUF6532 domain-containing protein n=1 Tax=Russula ochroleuca TaxID=152965 RepID=A0A9P5N1Q4_9AGAM|nr:hypothetical protein DFH94DRAFT_713756 [Russula ochroleuca]